LSRAAMSVSRAMARSMERRGRSVAVPPPTKRAALRPPPAPPPLKKKTRSRGQRAATPEPRRQRRGRGGVVFVLEDYATKPSRKSTRKSANRLKAGNKLGRSTRRLKQKFGFAICMKKNSVFEQPPFLSCRDKRIAI